jgi:hypothetical protein
MTDNELLKSIIPFCREFRDALKAKKKKTVIVSELPNNSSLIMNS